MQKLTREFPFVTHYVLRVSGELRWVTKNYEVAVFVKPMKTQMLMRPKGRILNERVVGPVYEIKCEDCGEMERTLMSRLLENCRPSTTTLEVSKHISIDQPYNHINLHNAKMLAVELRWYERGVGEAIHNIMANSSPSRDGETMVHAPDLHVMTHYHQCTPTTSTDAEVTRSLVRDERFLCKLIYIQ